MLFNYCENVINYSYILKQKKENIVTNKISRNQYGRSENVFGIFIVISIKCLKLPLLHDAVPCFISMAVKQFN